VNTFGLGRQSGLNTFGLGGIGILLAKWRNVFTFDVLIAKRVVRQVNIAKLKQYEVKI